MVAVRNEQDNALTPQLLEEGVRGSEAIRDVSMKVRHLLSTACYGCFTSMCLVREGATITEYELLGSFLPLSSISCGCATLDSVFCKRRARCRQSYKLHNALAKAWQSTRDTVYRYGEHRCRPPGHNIHHTELAASRASSLPATASFIHHLSNAVTKTTIHLTTFATLATCY